MEKACAERNVPIIGRIPFDPAIPDALGRGEVPSQSCPALAAAARDVWKRLEDLTSLAVPCAECA